MDNGLKAGGTRYISDHWGTIALHTPAIYSLMVNALVNLGPKLRGTSVRA